MPHITLKSIANNAEIDVIWERWQEMLEPLRAEPNDALGRTLEEWEIPREPGDPWPEAATSAWNKLGAAQTVQAKEAALRSLNRARNRHYTLDDVPNAPRVPWEPGATDLHTKWWEARIARQREIDASIAAKADFEYLYDKLCEDRRKVRVAGPLTVESISPHRVLDVDENDELVDNVAEARLGYGETQDFASVILEHLRTSGVQQAHKEDRLAFSSLTPWPGDLVCAEGRYVEGGDDAGAEKRAAIFIGPEFGTVARPDLVAAAREAADVGFDVLIACAFNYDAHASEFRTLGRVPILKARMNADLHMAGDLKNTGKGNLFVMFTGNARGVHTKVHLTYWTSWIFLSLIEWSRRCDWPSRKHCASELIRILAYLGVPARTANLLCDRFDATVRSGRGIVRPTVWSVRTAVRSPPAVDVHCLSPISAPTA